MKTQGDRPASSIDGVAIPAESLPFFYEAAILREENRQLREKLSALHQTANEVYLAAGAFADVFAEFGRKRAKAQQLLDAHDHLVAVMRKARDGSFYVDENAH